MSVQDMLNGLREGVDMYNWDIIAGFVNISSITSKTPKQVRANKWFSHVTFKASHLSKAS